MDKQDLIMYRKYHYPCNYSHCIICTDVRSEIDKLQRERKAKSAKIGEVK